MLLKRVHLTINDAILQREGAVAIRRLQNKADPAINNRVKVSTAISK